MAETTYEIMHGNRLVASVTAQGYCRIFLPQFLPFHLYLEERGDVDTLVNNVTNFQFWCATRVLTLDRQFAKEILGSIGAVQAVTDRERAQIALSYRCVCLTDIYWVRMQGEDITFEETNLYDNHLSNAFVDVSLRGKQFTVQNRELAQDLSTSGHFPKAWLRTETGFVLLKDGGREAVRKEVLASEVCQCFSCEQTAYRLKMYDGEEVSASDIMTSKKYGIVSREAFEIYARNHDLDALEYILELDGYSYYMMNILDYLVGNTDRHWGNWGFLVDNESNRPLRLHPLMDLNQSFRAYDTIEGANCQTVLPRRMTQQEAAAEAVRQIGWNQIKEIDSAWFSEFPKEYRMLQRRYDFLREIHAGTKR